MESRPIKEENLEKLKDFLKIKVNEEYIVRKRDNNWRQRKGGKNRVKSAKKEGKFDNQLCEARKNAKEKSVRWHTYMKKNKPEEYYKMQYEKFKKIGDYKFKTEKGELVRNELELETANWLNKNNIEYKYEPYIQIKEKAFFPDFIISEKIIIECTSWRGHDKAIKLKRKIRYLSKKYKIYILIPKALNNYYKVLTNYLIFELDKKLFP
jgi:hypothetical protein